MTTPLVEFKTALVTSIATALGDDVAVSRRPPANPLELHGDDGTGAAVWLADVTVDANEIHLGLPVDMDEEGTIDVVAQVLGDDDTDLEVETQAVALFTGIVEPLLEDPSLGLGIPLFEVLRLSYTYTCGVMGTETERFGARFEIALTYRARLQIGA